MRDFIHRYLKKSDWKIKENSNEEYSLQGMQLYLSSEINKDFWLNEVYTQDIRNAHYEGDFHIHDLSYLSVYCVGWDLYDLLLTGFRGVPGKVQSRPPRRLGSALGQLANFFYTLQGEAAGAQAVSNFDTLMAPFIRYEGLTYKEVKQTMQEFIFNLNVPTRVGFQTPFTNITMDVSVSPIYKDVPVLIGGIRQKETYGEFQKEMDMINRAFLEVMTEGDANGRVFTFPIPTYNITRDFPWDKENLDLLWEVTAKYGTPYFSNFLNSDMKPEDVRSMCCRLRIDNRDLKKRGGGLYGANPLTGSIGVVTINLPKIAYEYSNVAVFMRMLEQKLELAKQSLEMKREAIEEFANNGLYPYANFYLRHTRERFSCLWKNHFSTIGIIGMNEACLNLFGFGIDNPICKSFAIEVLDFIRNKLLEFQEETGNIYNLEASPAEGASYSLARKDGNKHEYYTNSTHLPVNFTDDLFEALDHQDDLQRLYTGGTVFHGFLGERIDDPNQAKKLIKHICNNYHLPYITLTPTFSTCPEHGYLRGEVQTCPKCLKVCEIYSRIVGYFSPIQRWNEGKRKEFDNRKEYNGDIEL